MYIFILCNNCIIITLSILFISQLSNDFFFTLVCVCVVLVVIVVEVMRYPYQKDLKEGENKREAKM